MFIGALVALGAEGEARAQVVPVVSLSGLVHPDRVRVMLDGAGELARDDRGMTAIGLGLGAAIPITAFPELVSGADLRVIPRLSLALGLVRGDGRLGVGGDLAWTFARAGALSASLGVGLDLHLGLASPASSFGALSALLAVRVGPAELTWRPTFTLPLATREDAVFGGTREQGVPLGFAPLALGLAIYLDALAL